MRPRLSVSADRRNEYGKPILDRGFNYETSLSDAVKFGIVSIDADNEK